MKTLVISDTHSLHLNWENKFPLHDGIDLIIHAGDLTNIGAIHEMNDFVYWFNNLPVKHKIMIAGNHDLGLDNFNRYTILDIFRGTNINYLEDSGVEIEGIKFWGSPVTPPFGNWAFMREPDKIKLHWDGIPDNTDVLITHAPPKGILDYVSRGENVGCPILLERIKEIKPLFHCYGHIHEPYGIKTIEDTTYINAAIVNDRYIPIRGGHIIDIKK